MNTPILATPAELAAEALRHKLFNLRIARVIAARNRAKLLRALVQS